MKVKRCDVCGHALHSHDTIEFGWWSQLDDNHQAYVHRGRCCTVMTEFVRDVVLGSG